MDKKRKPKPSEKVLIKDRLTEEYMERYRRKQAEGSIYD